MAVPIVSLTVNLGADNHTVDTYKGMVSLRVLTDRVMEEFGNVRERLRKGGVREGACPRRRPRLHRLG